MDSENEGEQGHVPYPFSLAIRRVKGRSQTLLWRGGEASNLSQTDKLQRWRGDGDPLRR